MRAASRQLPDLEAFLQIFARSSVAVALALLPGAAVAETIAESRVQGMGGAVRGDPLGNSSMSTNPAGLARAYLYGLEVGFTRAGPGDRNAVGLNVVDSKTQPSLAMGVAYSYEFTDPDTPVELDGHNARIAFAHPILPNQLSMGVGLHYMHFNRTGGAEDLKAFTLDAGLVFSLTSALHLGLCGQNLIDVNDAEAPVLAGGGLAYTGEYATLDFDTVFDFSTQDKAKPVFQGGIELLLAKVVPLRAGFERNQATEITRISGGLGFMTAEDESAGSQLNLAFTKAIEEAKDFSFTAGFVLFL